METENKFAIGRHVNGVTLNPIEYLLADDDKPKLFDSEQEANQFITDNGLGNPDDYIISELEPIK